MTKKNSLKRALFASVLSLILCFSMLVGSTFAWFTDSVSSDTNKIVAGNLDVELEYKKVVGGVATDWAPVVGRSDIFDPNALWEPGRIEVVYLKVSNLGSLALKYALSVTVANETVGLTEAGQPVKLSDHLVFTTVEMNDALTVYTEEEARALAEAGSKGMESYIGSTKALEAKDKANDEDYVALIVYMPKTVGNEANYRGTAVPTIALGINLVATQYTNESDSFGPDYDAGAEFPIVDNGVLEIGTSEPLTLKAGNVTTHIPANAPAGFYELSISDAEVEDTASGKTAKANVTLTRDGVAVVPGAATFTVETEIGVMADIAEITYNGETLADGEYEYDVMTGIVSIDTNAVGPIEVSYDFFGTEVVIENNAIQSGIFTKNPASVDLTLADVNEDDTDPRVIVEYDKNAVSSATAMLRLSSTRAAEDKVYYVSEKATTVVVGRDNMDYGLDENGEYAFENGAVPVKLVGDNALYSIMSNANNKNVYILPGEYKESTVIRVNSSMSIIGLGNADDVRIIKVTGSKSNRHLFNCRNDDQYIQVTFRNLHLDATKNNKADGASIALLSNAAIQGYGLVKIKCYDLTIKKTENPFTLNSGGKSGVFFYVQDCSTNVSPNTNVFGKMIDVKALYCFYYYNLTTSQGVYKNTLDSNQKNQQMAWDDWDWKN